MVGTYGLDTWKAWRDWLKDSAFVAGCGWALSLIPGFEMPWYGYLCVAVLAIVPAGYNTWKMTHVALLDLRASLDGPGLEFVDGNAGPPFTDVVGPNRRLTFRIGVRAIGGQTRHNVRVRVTAINRYSNVSQLPALLRSMDGDQPAAIDIQQGQPGFFEVAKVIDNRNSLMLCRWHTEELPELPHGTYLMLLMATADNCTSVEAEVQITSTQDSIEGRIVRVASEPLAFSLPPGRVPVPTQAVTPSLQGATTSVLTPSMLEVVSRTSFTGNIAAFGTSDTVVRATAGNSAAFVPGISIPPVGQAPTVHTIAMTIAGTTSADMVIPPGVGAASSQAFNLGNGVFQPSAAERAQKYRNATGIRPVMDASVTITPFGERTASIEPAPPTNAEGPPEFGGEAPFPRKS